MVIFAGTATLVFLLLWMVPGSKLPNSKQSNSKPSVPATTPSAMPDSGGPSHQESTYEPAATNKRGASSPASLSAPPLRTSAENALKNGSDTPLADDPQELWKQVSKGSTHAEVALALLYLDGNKVAKNCEEAAVLLTAASRRGSTKAKSLLEKHYAERCP
jgi:TPR repeat protein